MSMPRALVISENDSRLRCTVNTVSVNGQTYRIGLNNLVFAFRCDEWVRTHNFTAADIDKLRAKAEKNVCPDPRQKSDIKAERKNDIK